MSLVVIQALDPRICLQPQAPRPKAQPEKFSRSRVLAAHKQLQAIHPIRCHAMQFFLINSQLADLLGCFSQQVLDLTLLAAEL